MFVIICCGCRSIFKSSVLDIWLGSECASDYLLYIFFFLPAIELAKWLGVRLRSKWLWVWILFVSLNPLMCIFLPWIWSMTVFFMILENPMSGKNLVLQWWPKMLSDNQIAVSLEGINRYLWFFTWRWSSKKGSFGWVSLVLSLVQLDFRTFWSSICLEEIQQSIDFCREIVSYGR